MAFNDELFNYVNGFRLLQPIGKRHYITFAIVKIRNNEELTLLEKEAYSDFIMYYEKQK